MKKWAKTELYYTIGPLNFSLNSGSGSHVVAPQLADAGYCSTKKLYYYGVRVPVVVGVTGASDFYGFKLHLIVDDRGELVSFFVTLGNVDERQGLSKMAKFIKGKLFGDKGYISKALAEELWDKGVQLVTRVRRNMKPVVLDDFDKVLLRKRSLIETINDQLNNISQLEHSRHRSLTGLMLNLVTALVAYSYQPNKPSLKLSLKTQAMVVVSDNNCFYTPKSLI